MTTDSPARTIAALAASAAARLVEAGLPPDEARIDATVLIRHALGWDAATWMSRATEPVPAAATPRIEGAIARRTRREPVSHIVGRREFYGRDFLVTADVLTPRPETELLVEQALHLIDQRAGPGRPPVRVLDVGTGSGSVALVVALERPLAVVTATDISGPALDVARANAARLGVAGRVRILHADLVPGGAGPFDVIVSNPPYVAESDRPDLPPEVSDYEPELALFGGDDGLEVVRRLAPAARVALADAGALAMEIGAGQAGQVQRILENAGFEWQGAIPDLQGIPRVVVASKRALL